MSMTHCRSSDIFCGLKPLEKRSLFKFNILTSIIMHFIYPPPPPSKFCISIVFDFFWDHCNTQEKLETSVMQNFCG